MSARPTDQTIAIVGTPSAGKTTLARKIAAAIGGRYLSMADLTRAARRDGWLTTDTEVHAGQRGVLNDGPAAVLAAALRQHAVSDPASLVVLDDAVTDTSVLEVFGTAEPHHRVRLHVIELDTRDLTLFRRVLPPFCPRCHPDPDAEPLQPAPPGTQQQSRCSLCRGLLFVRSRDNPKTFQQRLAAYRQHRDALTRTAARHGIRWTRLEADEPPERCAARAYEAITGPPGSRGPRPAPGPRRPTP
jgi:adenylate kinase family enzyme